MGVSILAGHKGRQVEFAGDSGRTINSPGDVWMHRKGIVGKPEIIIDSPSFRGQILDESGAKVIGAQITLTGKTVDLLIEAIALDSDLCRILKPDVVERIRAKRGVQK